MYSVDKMYIIQVALFRVQKKTNINSASNDANLKWLWFMMLCAFFLEKMPDSKRPWTNKIKSIFSLVLRFKVYLLNFNCFFASWREDKQHLVCCSCKWNGMNFCFYSWITFFSQTQQLFGCWTSVNASIDSYKIKSKEFFIGGKENISKIGKWVSKCLNKHLLAVLNDCMMTFLWREHHSKARNNIIISLKKNIHPMWLYLNESILSLFTNTITVSTWLQLKHIFGLNQCAT